MADGSVVANPSAPDIEWSHGVGPDRGPASKNRSSLWHPEGIALPPTPEK